MKQTREIDYHQRIWWDCYSYWIGLGVMATLAADHADTALQVAIERWSRHEVSKRK